jgi:hypothetical protein
MINFLIISNKKSHKKNMFMNKTKLNIIDKIVIKT